MDIHKVYKISIEVQTILKDINIFINSGKKDTISCPSQCLFGIGKSLLFLFPPLSLCILMYIYVHAYLYVHLK